MVKIKSNSTQEKKTNYIYYHNYYKTKVNNNNTHEFKSFVSKFLCYREIYWHLWII